RQKSSADHHRRDIQFEDGQHAFLRVRPVRGVVRFGKRGKLHPRFIGLFEVLERVGEVAYRLALPPELSGIHNQQLSSSNYPNLPSNIARQDSYRTASTRTRRHDLFPDFRRAIPEVTSSSSGNLVDRVKLGLSVRGPTQATVVAQFRDYHAEKFSGQGDSRIVDEWIQGLEFIFEVMESPDRYRVVCAQLQLTGDARLWWNAYWSMRPGEKAGCTWDMFKDLVRDKYYPSYYRAEMERQFLALRQGTRTVDEYEREFTRLAGFAPDLVRTELQKIPPCPTCGRLHRGECRAGQDVCYFCQEPGHFASRCPKKLQQQPQQPQQQQPRQQAQRPQQQQQQQRGRQQARVYAVDQAEAAQQPGTMSGMVVLNDIPVFALFDTGATHTFISRRCLDAIGVHAVTAVDPIEVSLASGRKI
ncbi:Unknown protein, partial [Striga hermonthica]